MALEPSGETSSIEIAAAGSSMAPIRWAGRPPRTAQISLVAAGPVESVTYTPRSIAGSIVAGVAVGSGITGLVTMESPLSAHVAGGTISSDGAGGLKDVVA